MENKILIRELENNKKGHNIFNKQTRGDLIELSDLIKTKRFSQIVVNLHLNEWVIASELFRKPNDYEESLDRCDRFVALKILEKLQYKNKRVRSMNVKEDLVLFETGDENDYLNNKDRFLTTKDVIKFMELENMHIDRIHFIITDISSDVLTDTLVPFLEQDLPFSTSIYKYPGNFDADVIPHRENISYIWDEYEYTTYQSMEEGVKNLPKNHYSKVKVKRNEKI